MLQHGRHTYDFDVALSFAGEDRDYVEDVNNALKAAGVRTFLDSDYLSDTWGEDLVDFFDGIYRKRSRFAILFISHHYAEKMWPRHERRSALARALEERAAYVLPVRLDDTSVDGLRPTIGYLDTRRTGIDALVRALTAKIAGRSGWPDGWPGDRAPRGYREIDEVVSERPPGWEYLFFAGVLHAEKAVLEAKYLDHELRYAALSGERMEDNEMSSFLRRMFNEIGALVRSLVSMMEPEVQERAFGPSGVAGDPIRIRHLAQRWNSAYEGLLDWATRIRGLSHDGRFDSAFELLARFADKPIEQYRSFVDELIEEVDRLPTALATSEPLTISLSVTVSIEEGLAEEFSAELARLASGSE